MFPKHAFLAGLLALALGATARADFIYTYSTVDPSPGVLFLSGSFLVPDDAILDGSITAAEIRSFLFTLPVGFGGVGPITFEPPEVLVTSAGGIPVDPLTGAFTAGGGIQISDGQSPHTISIPTSSLPTTTYSVLRVQPSMVTFGTGRWEVSGPAGVVPEPSAVLLLVSAAGFWGIIGGLRNRRGAG